MTKARAFDISKAFMNGHVETMREGEWEEYHELFHELLKKEKSKVCFNNPLSLEEVKELVKCRYNHVWIEELKYNFSTCGFVDIEKGKGVCAICDTLGKQKFTEETYGKEWRAYKYNPSIFSIEDWYNE